MIATLRKSRSRTRWNTISFVSTLYVRPIIDLLVAEVPVRWQADVRLGLQEALVNASKHGNCLDPSKRVTVQIAHHPPMYEWIICDEGVGFECCCQLERKLGVEIADGDCSGRGIYILKRVFDCVEWNEQGNTLRLSKAIYRLSSDPLIQ